jgi:hypothetical protein
MGPTVFDQLVKEKVVAINGDLLENNLGLSAKDREILVKHTNVIFHCGANTEVTERLDISIKVCYSMYTHCKKRRLVKSRILIDY